MTAVDDQRVPVTVAPIIGVSRWAAASATIAEALGLAVASDDAIQEGHSQG